MKPRLLDLFCGAGGATKGYEQAGFEVWGVDLEPQPNYCGSRFIQADALAGSPSTLIAQNFDAVHASPPCQAYSAAAPGRKRDDHPELIEPVRALLEATGLPWVIENVPLAPLPNGFILCGSTFGLPIIRHRLFEVSPAIESPENPHCPQKSFGRGVTHGPGFYPYARKKWRPAWREHVMPVVWPWMTLEESGQAIPPAYTEWVGRQLFAYLRARDGLAVAA